MAPVTLENCDEIIDGLFLAGVSAAVQTQRLVDLGFKAVVCCLREPEFPTSDFHAALEYYRVDVEDIGREPIELFWPEAAQFIHGFLSQKQLVLVHCRAGVSRSASTVLAYLMLHQGYTLVDAFRCARTRRPVVTPNLGFMDKLCELERAARKSDSTVSYEKYASWYIGEQVGEEMPDISSCLASPSGETEMETPTRMTSKQRRAKKVIAMKRLTSALSPQNKPDIDQDLLNGQSPDQVVRNRIDKVRTMLFRHAAHDPELGYCQGMHLVAALFAASSKTPPAAFWRFHAFMLRVRGLWLAGFPMLETGTQHFEELAKERPWFKHLRSHLIEPNMYLPQAWLTLFTTWLPLATLAECVELLEGTGLAGMLAMTLALLDHVGEHLLRIKRAGDLTRAMQGLPHMAPDAHDLAHDVRELLPQITALLETPTESASTRHRMLCERSGSRVVGMDGFEAPIEWPCLPTWLAAAKAGETPDHLEPIQAIKVSSTTECSCWSWALPSPKRASTVAVSVPSSNHARVSVRITDQQREVAKCRRRRSRHFSDEEDVESPRQRQVIVWSEVWNEYCYDELPP